MAGQMEMDYIYSNIDKIFRLSMGDHGDFSGAMYQGDNSLSLEEAQKAKHRFIVDQLDISPDSRVLDMGCGWGPFLHYLKHEAGAAGVGLSLSHRQVEHCKKNGLDVRLMDCRKATVSDLGAFDAVVSLGAFEHFCSLEAFKQGRQEDIYKSFFKNVSDFLPLGGRFYLQTMVFGKNMLDYEDLDIHAPKTSDNYILALMEKQFPGSWLPYGAEMVIRNAKPYFDLKYRESGRLDYIETIKQWNRRFRKFNLKKYGLYGMLIPKLFTNKEFRHRLSVFRLNPNKICFERQLMDHFRMVFEKK